MQSQPSTPRRQTTIAHTPTTPTAPANTSAHHAHVMQASPHYTTTRRHSLYGVEDRVVIDPGSRIWKVGFSGEGRPRDVFYGCKNGPDSSLWNLRRATDPTERIEEDKMLEIRLQSCLRGVFHDSLLTDPKARKVILIEHPLLPIYIKELIAKILFDNQVPSISFASSHLLSLFSVGKITGLVMDCGHLESAVMPIFAARPMYPQLGTTPLAGSRLTSHLRALLLMFGTYLPPPSSLSSATNVPAANRATRVPSEILTDAVVEEIKARCCFVGEALSRTDGLDANSGVSTGRHTPIDDVDEMERPPPSSSDGATNTAPSESDFSHAGSSQQGTLSEYSVISNPPATTGSGDGRSHLQALASLYQKYSTATELHMKVVPPVSQQLGTGRGTLIIPGWIRERAAEVLFEGGDVDENSVAEVLLDTLLKVPVDLRKTMASSILVVGGTAMLPGFIPRLYAELVRAVSTPPSPSPSRSTLHPSHASTQPTPVSSQLLSHPTSSHDPQRPPTTRASPRPQRRPQPVYDKYAPLRQLTPYFAIMNNPSPADPATRRAAANSGKSPGYAPHLMAWVGGSLAGSIKTGGTEVTREKWDEALTDPTSQMEGIEDTSMDISSTTLSPGMAGRTPSTPTATTPLATASPMLTSEESAEMALGRAAAILPDWTRSPLPMGAPPARALGLSSLEQSQGQQQVPTIAVSSSSKMQIVA